MHHLRSLTGLRFVAALVVLLHHLSLGMPGLPGAALFSGGFVGVGFFFVLSGFVLTYSWSGSRTSAEFFVRRAARVLPLHLVAAVTTLAVLSVHPVAWQVAAANLSLVHAWWPDETVAFSLVGAAWSLSCEVFFYALFPVAVVAVRSMRRPLAQAIWLVVGMCLVGLLGLSKPGLGAYLYHLPPVRLADFLVGILLAEACRRGWRPGMSVRAALALVAATYGLIVIVGSVWLEGPDHQWMLSLPMIVPFGLLIAAAAMAEQRGDRPAVGSGRWVTLGRWSFALYLVHGPVLGLVHAYLGRATGPGAWVAVGASVALCIAFAGAAYAVVERPAQRFVQRNGLRMVAVVRRRSPQIARVDTAADL